MYMKDNKEVKKIENKVSTEKVKESFETFKKALKNSWVYHKGLWITGIVILVLIVLFGVGTSLMNNQTVVSKITYSFMPKEVEADLIDGDSVMFYAEINDEYDGEETTLTVDNLFKMYKFYYLNDDDEKVYLEDGIYRYKDSHGEETAKTMGFEF